MNAPSVVRFRTQKLPKQAGEQARLKVAQGADQGAVFVLFGDRATIGRGENADIFITDLKASRMHAEIQRSAEGWAVRDLGSANGILWNGSPSRGTHLRVGDTVTVGETVLEFYPAEAGAALLAAPPKSRQEILSLHQSVSTQKKGFRSLLKVGVPAGATAPSSNGISSIAKANPRKLMIYGVLGVAIALTLLEDDKPKVTSKTKSKQSKAPSLTPDRGLASYLPKSPTNDETRRYADYFYKAGFREYREKNYLRAMTSFETVLQIDPYHELAKLYLANCRMEMDEAVKSGLRRGKTALEAGKLREAKGQFESVMRLLFRDQSNPMYIEAKDQLEATLKAMKAGGSG